VCAALPKDLTAGEPVGNTNTIVFLTQNNSFQSPPSPQEHWYFPKEEADFSLVQEVVRVARLLRAQCQMTKERPDCENLFLLHANVLVLVAVFGKASITTETLK